jgi:hypothetical protein
MVTAMSSLKGQLNYKQNMQTQDKNKFNENALILAMQCSVMQLMYIDH